MQKPSSQKLFQLLFHFLFWGYSAVLPIVDRWGSSEAKEQELIKMFMAIAVVHVILFFINTEYLIPKVLQKKGIGTYIACLVVMGFIFIFIEGIVKQWLHIRHRDFFDFRTVYSVLFILSVSSVYGFIVMMVAQEKQKREVQAEQLQSELSFLRSQISPHFIFNILNSIVYLIRSKSENAESVTIKLSELMRYMLYESDEKHVPLDKEIDYLKNYIDLQRVRFEEDVQIKTEINGQIGSQLIEPMLMIPFVENAFKHGVGLVQEPVIEISVSCQEKVLNFVVKNKIAPENPENKDKNSGIGLKNVKRRLELLYPEAHKLEISKVNGCFISSLELRLK